MMSSADGTKGRCPLDSRPSRGAPLRGERPCAGSGRALPCTRAYAASTKGRCPLDSRWG